MRQYHYEEIVSSLGSSVMTATVSEKAWMGKVAAFGCIACHMRFDRHMAATVHHITEGGRRLGHFFTIPLCIWHHMALCLPGKTSTQMTAIYGPSIMKSRREFEQTFGEELTLLQQVKECLGYKHNPA